MSRAMVGLVYVAVAVLSLLSVGHPAPVTDCDSLLRPLAIQGRDQLLGKWIFIAESTNITGSRMMTKMLVDSVWGRTTAANESDVINQLQVQKMFGQCFTVTSKTTLKNSTLFVEEPVQLQTRFLQTGCLDCLVTLAHFTSAGNHYSAVELLSRRNKVSDAELQEYLKQVECLNLPSPAIMDPEKGLCPEPTSQETDSSDLTSLMKNLGSGFVDEFDKIMRSSDGLNMFLKLISAADEANPQKTN